MKNTLCNVARTTKRKATQILIDACEQSLRDCKSPGVKLLDKLLPKK